jgi:transcriptional regulator with XRE-family HTH domain
MQTGKLIGQKLKATRLKSDWTIQELSALSKVSPNMISRIERGLTVPSVEILVKLGRAFGKSINYFVAELETTSEVVFSSSAKRLGTTFEDERNLLAESMTDGLRDPQFSSFVCTVKKGGHSGAQTMYHPGDELIYLLEGTLRVHIAEKSYFLSPGDSLSFKSHLPHSWENAGDEEARMIWTLSQFPSVF